MDSPWWTTRQAAAFLGMPERSARRKLPELGVEHRWGTKLYAWGRRTNVVRRMPVLEWWGEDVKALRGE